MQYKEHSTIKKSPQYTTDFLEKHAAPNMLLQSLQSSSPREVKAGSPCDDSWKKKKFQAEETGMCPRHASLPVRQNRSRRRPFRGGGGGRDSGPDSMMQGAMCAGWHMVLGIMQRHRAGPEPGALHTALLGQAPSY